MSRLWRPRLHDDRTHVVVQADNVIAYQRSADLIYLSALALNFMRDSGHFVRAVVSSIPFSFASICSAPLDVLKFGEWGLYHIRPTGSSAPGSDRMSLRAASWPGE
jgi:hypothetical protein